MSKPHTLIFDLDGTLSDPSEGIYRSINFALDNLGFTPIAWATVSHYIGPPLDHAFRAITGTDSPEVVSRLVAKYRERYADIGYAENVIYPGIPEALAALSGSGQVLGVCTSKRMDFAEKILELFNIRHHFEFVSGGDIGIQKHQQLGLLLDTRTVGHASVMIGDRAVDVGAARMNGLVSVGVLWGHGTLEELINARADTILQSVSQLAALRTTAA